MQIGLGQAFVSQLPGIRRLTKIIGLEQQLQPCLLSCGDVGDVVAATVQDVKRTAREVCYGAVSHACNLHGIALDALLTNTKDCSLYL